MVSAISAYSEDDLNYARSLGRDTRVMCSPNITLGINFLIVAAKLLRKIAPFAANLALAAYQRATELAPADATYWRTLATFSGQYSFQVEQVGIPAAQQVLELRPDEAASFDLLGWTYLAANVTRLAEENLLAALRLDPDYAPAHLHLGITYLQMNKLESARAHLLQAQALDPEGAEGRAAAQLLALYFP